MDVNKTVAVCINVTVKRLRLTTADFGKQKVLHILSFCL